MSHAPRDWSGYVPKRYLNAIRTREAVDPFYSQVLALAPLTGNPGDLPVDLGPLALPCTLVNPSAMTYPLEMNGDDPLFGLNTLYVNRAASDALKYFEFLDAVTPFTSVDSFCWEGWMKFINVPNNQLFCGPRFQPTVGTPFTAWAVTNTGVRVGANSSRFKAATVNTWHYFCGQYIGQGDGKGSYYLSLDGVSMGAPFNLAAAINTIGFALQLIIGSLPPNGAAEYRFGQLRYTAANRYGSNPAPMPSGPWPTRGP